MKILLTRQICDMFLLNYFVWHFLTSFVSKMNNVYVLSSEGSYNPNKS